MRLKNTDGLFTYPACRGITDKPQCLFCRRVLNPKRAYFQVHLIDGGSSLLHPQDEELYTPDGGDMAFFEVGADCMKRVGIEWGEKISPTKGVK